jgi:trehalose/maltose hydrolase-like predicted phosphorylase
MSRPKPNVLLQYTNSRTYKSELILEADAIWAVFYQQKPFNLKSMNSLTNYPGPKYKKTSFSNPGHAFNLAKKLNSMFKTTEFSVVKLTSGEEIVE